MKNKKQLGIAILIILSMTDVTLAGWLDDWVGNKTVTSPGYYQGQTRGYFTGGSFQARWKVNNENLIDFQAPRIKVGCGGIDLFAGGLSFLDPDRLVQKLQSVLQAAPAVAMDMALKSMCKECSETVRGFEGLANRLNAMTATDCQSIRQHASKVMPTIPQDNVLNFLVGRLNTNLNLTRDYHESNTQTQANNGNPGVDMRQATQSCSARFKAIYGEGSLIQRITADLNFDAYADLLRGLLGDVVITFDAATNTLDMDPIPDCRENKSYSLQDFMSGSIQERPLNGACRDNSGQDFQSFVSQSLDTISNKLESGTTVMTLDEQNFIDISPLPVLKTLQWGVMTNNMAGAKSTLRDALAVSYAFYTIDDLYRNVQYIVSHSKEAAKKPTGSQGDPDYCDPIIFGPAIQQVYEWEKKIMEIHNSARESFRMEVSNLVDYTTLIKNTAESYRDASRETMQKFSN